MKLDKVLHFVFKLSRFGFVGLILTHISYGEKPNSTKSFGGYLSIGRGIGIGTYKNFGKHLKLDVSLMYSFGGFQHGNIHVDGFEEAPRVSSGAEGISIIPAINFFVFKGIYVAVGGGLTYEHYTLVFKNDSLEVLETDNENTFTYFGTGKLGYEWRRSKSVGIFVNYGFIYSLNNTKPGVELKIENYIHNMYRLKYSKGLEVGIQLNI